jgi:hypothetical protein
MSEPIFSWMMDEFNHWPKPYLLLSATYDGILSWMIEIWMKNQLVSDSICNIVTRGDHWRTIVEQRVIKK